MAFDRTPSIGFLTNRAARLLVRALDVRLSGIGMRAAHMPVFMALSGGDALTQKQLAAFAEIEQPTMAATLARMEAARLIEREVDRADRRSSLVRLSQEGLRKGELVQAIVEDITALAQSRFNEEEAVAYRELVVKMITALEQDPMRASMDGVDTVETGQAG